MLINTVILFLKDLLPIFILFCLLKANSANVVISKKVIFIILLLSIFGVIATFKLLPSIGDMAFNLFNDILCYLIDFGKAQR